ncbi:GNAT family N-acetyltransferase [Marinimicrobium agarilyticum]|uniref:GNAT family N-acetyltransferase n=1 Tax=Marinimicrobium agarilyticum TaxID=306546 RepID=UPI0003FA2B27|nr:GNAT family N-acetyltransferase [Marinimicrobium agarilyticum]
MAERLTIEPLTPDTPQLEPWLAIIGRWHHEHCVSRGLNSSIERRIEQIRKHFSGDALPVTLVAHKAGQPLGSVSLLRYQAAGTGNRLWLSNLYVEASVRKGGLGEALLEHACRYAKAQGEKALWLFTDDQQAFYRKRGWRPAGDARISRTEVDILVREL